MTTQKHDDSANSQSVYIPIATVIPGNSAPHNPQAQNPLRDPVQPPLPQK